MILDKICGVRVAPAILCAAAMFFGGCASQNQTSGTVPPSSKFVVACTISTLCSLVASVGGDSVDVRGVVPVGVSPETYEPRPSDIVALASARVLVENGSGLESWLDKALRSAGAPALKRVTLADAIPLRERSSGNPHLWLDPAYAAAYVQAIAAALAHADPARAAAYRANANREISALGMLDRWIRAQIQTVPPDRRTMICFHDAWYYFDRRYGIKNIGAVEPSPGQEPSPGYFAHLIALAKANNVRAVFGEPQFSPKLANALATGAGIRTVVNLYDDTLGTSPQLSNYDGMMRYDVRVIVKALKS
jgi:manganese/iron transport system substrate-binding protein